MDLGELRTVVAALRAEGSDVTGVEVKRAIGGYPATVAPTLSAFGNTPGGGILLFGLDEAAGFASVGVYDVAACKAALASQARQAVRPPVVISELDDVLFEGAAVVIARVDELPASNKPCRLTSSGKAYLRAYDGDYQLSEAEEQAFLAARTTPTFDRQPVEGTGEADLAQDLLASYLAACRAASSSLNAFPDAEILYRTGVTVATPAGGGDRVLTVAGLLALGAYPQQHLPNCVIQASVSPRSTDPAGTRAADVRRFDGPVPTMLDEALRWVQRNTRTRVRFGADGQGRDEPEFPAEAVRELLSNALIHRDLGPYALTEAITLKLDDRQLVLSNPGGLWGLTLDRLGKTGVTSARNGVLLRISQNIRSREGNRVVEALATGIPTVLAALREAGMAPPHFYDQGIRFTVRVPNHTLLAGEDLQWLTTLSLSAPLSDQQRHALVGMRHGTTWTNQSLRASFPMDSREAQRALAGLVEAGVAVAEGERRARTYRLADGLGPRQPGASNATISEPDDGSQPRDDARPARQGTRTRSGPTSRAANAAAIQQQLAQQAMTVPELVEATGLTARQVGYALTDLRARGTVVLRGGRGRTDSRYELVRPPAPPPVTTGAPRT